MKDAIDLGKEEPRDLIVETNNRIIKINKTFVWFDRPGESSPEKDCCW